MTTFQHITVLREEAAALLATRPGVRVLDGTLGGGGHAEALLEKDAVVIGLDQDPRALAAAKERLAKFGGRFTAVHSNFRDARNALDSLGIDRVDGALVDLGVSSPQLDEAERGFSFARGGPLDMRMDTTQGRPLSQWLSESELHEIERAIRVYGEEQFARNIAKSIKQALEVGDIEDTRALAELVSHSIPRSQWPRTIHPATKTFQALRIAVNDELGALEAWLDALPSIVEVGGRAAAIAFHSLEDRPVKQRFASMTKGCTCPPELPFCGCGKTAGWKLVTRKPISASFAETESNPRARSAHLRCIERVAES